MADGDITMLLSQATEMMDEVYDLGIIPIDNRFGATAQHIQDDPEEFLGGKMHKKFLTTMFTGARSSSNLEGDAPDAYKIGLTDISIDESDLRSIDFTLKYGIPASLEVRGKHSAINLAEELVLQAQESVGEKRNQMLNQDANCVKALVAALYKADGDTYSQATSAFLKIDNGSISAFHPGEILDIRAASDYADIRSMVVVNDVIHSPYFFGRNVGPGIVVTQDTTYGRTPATGAGNGTSTQDQYLDEIADGDEIVCHGEVDSSSYASAFSSLIDLSASPGAYFGVTRTTAGNHYLVPYGRDYSTGGVSATLNVDTHFGEMNNILGMVFGPSRQYRRNRGFQLTAGIIAQAQPDIVADVARGAGEGSAQFTRKIASDFGQGKEPLTAVAGWEGSVLHSPSLPPIVLQSEPLAPSDKIRIFDPACLKFIRLGGGKPRFIRAPGQPIWHVRANPTSGNLTKTLQASAFVIETLFCNQPQLCYGIHGVTSSI